LATSTRKEHEESWCYQKHRRPEFNSVVSDLPVAKPLLRSWQAGTSI
jgi:hypothetical protein